MSSLALAPPPSPPAWVVHKFGGTSLAASECVAEACDLIRGLPLELPAVGSGAIDHSLPPLRKLIVVSAMGEVKGVGSAVARLIASRSGSSAQPKQQEKVTNTLIRLTQLAADRDETYLELMDQLHQRHKAVAEDLLGGDGEPVITALASDFCDLRYILRSVWLSRAYGGEHPWWLGLGEIWSARLMVALLNKLDREARAADPSTPPQEAVLLDAREIVHLTTHKDPMPDHERSKAKMDEWLLSSPLAQSARILVVTGYIASTSCGVPTTLGRDGSDYSASIFGALVRARAVTIWSDVDGVYSANPTQVADAVVLQELSYDEASELAYFGAKVLHPKTMTPLVKWGIPCHLRNTFNAQHQGTCIVSAEVIAKRDAQEAQEALQVAAVGTDNGGPLKRSPSSSLDGSVVGYGVRGFSEISKLSLLLVEGTGMIGVPGVCARLFGALREEGVSVVLVTQAGSEHSICLCLPAAQGQIGLDAVRREFRDELERAELQTVALRTGVACLAIVGDGMRARRGAAARMFAALADARINVVAIAQGSSERNISVIVAEQDVARGLKAVHQAFLRAPQDSLDYEPLLTPSPQPGATEVLATSSSSPSTTSASSSSPPTSPSFPMLDRLFPLPLLATLSSLRARGNSISSLQLVLPRALTLELIGVGSSPSGLIAQWSETFLQQLLREIGGAMGIGDSECDESVGIDRAAQMVPPPRLVHQMGMALLTSRSIFTVTPRKPLGFLIIEEAPKNITIAKDLDIDEALALIVERKRGTTITLRATIE